MWHTPPSPCYLIAWGNHSQDGLGGDHPLVMDKPAQANIGYSTAPSNSTNLVHLSLEHPERLLEEQRWKVGLNTTLGRLLLVHPALVEGNSPTTGLDKAEASPPMQGPPGAGGQQQVHRGGANNRQLPEPSVLPGASLQGGQASEPSWTQNLSHFKRLPMLQCRSVVRAGSFCTSNFNGFSCSSPISSGRIRWHATSGCTISFSVCK